MNVVVDLIVQIMSRNLMVKCGSILGVLIVGFSGVT